MALRQLILNKKIQERSAKITALRADETKLKDEEVELEKALDEAETDEEVKVVEDSADELEKKIKEKSDEIAKLETEKAELEAELAEIEDEQPNNEEKEDGEKRKMAKKVQTRNNADVMTIRESLQIENVRSFYQNIANAMVEKRSLTGAEKVVPVEVIDRIESKLGDYSTLIGEVTVEKIGGTGPLDWLDEFDSMPLAEIFPEIIDLLESSISSKKK